MSKNTECVEIIFQRHPASESLAYEVTIGMEVTSIEFPGNESKEQSEWTVQVLEAKKQLMVDQNTLNLRPEICLINILRTILFQIVIAYV